MNIQYVNFHFAQLSKAWAKSRHNKYSDRNKQDYHDTLEALFKKLKETDFNTLDDPTRLEYQQIIDFFFTSLEFLDNSTLNLIPFEFVECLKFALKDWVDKDSELIIVTSLVKGLESYSFNPTLVFYRAYYDIIEKSTDIRFNKKLIQINLPDFLSKDYLSNAVLYHELGHFVDCYYSISSILSTVLFELYKKGAFSPTENSSIFEIFPFLEDPDLPISDKEDILKNHCGELFSDVFAAQYIAYSSTYFLDYVCVGNERIHPSHNHPAFNVRKKMVSDFINHVPHFFLSKMQEVTQKITGKELKPRFHNLDKQRVINLLPISIHSPEELHSLFPMGWDLWLNHYNDFITENQMEDVKPSDVYNIINNLIEKSISNYIITSRWPKTC